ncbi:MAG: acyloxyacyl hydrolase [Bacteroidetes bacterium]|nr:acyloxyacyl hydrolase [Bacteroidota bacterium]
MQVQSYGGFVFPHHEEMKRQEQHVVGLEASWYAKGTGYKGMDRHFWNPRLGGGLLFLRMGDSLNGIALGPHGFIEFNLKERSHSVTTMRCAGGIGYFSRPFSMDNNLRNRANGTRLNGLMQLQITRRQYLGKNTEASLGLGITHYSNGNWKFPNWGINMLLGHVGLAWFFNNAPANRPAWPRFNADTPCLRGFWNVSVRTGRRQIAIDDNRTFTMFMGEVVYHHPQSRSRLWRMGVNYFFDPIYPYIKFGPWPVRNRSFGSVSEVSLLFGHEYRVGRLGIIADGGLYLYRPTDSKRKYYEAVGFKYYLNPNVVLMSRLRVHLFTADYMEWGVGFNLPDKNIRKPLFKKEFVLF